MTRTVRPLIRKPLNHLHNPYLYGTWIQGTRILWDITFEVFRDLGILWWYFRRNTVEGTCQRRHHSNRNQEWHCSAIVRTDIRTIQAIKQLSWIKNHSELYWPAQQKQSGNTKSWLHANLAVWQLMKKFKLWQNTCVAFQGPRKKRKLNLLFKSILLHYTETHMQSFQ